MISAKPVPVRPEGCEPGSETLAGKRAFALLLLVLLLEAVLFSWNFSAFFGSDSVFFFARRLERVDQLPAVFSQLDDRGHYRPLTLAFFSFVLHPVFGQNHIAYHFVPLLFHFVNTLLVFVILRKAASSAVAAAAGTFFFGLHPIAYFVTYSITFMPDFTYAFLLLGAIASFIMHDETRRAGWLLLCVGSLVLSLLCKETAVTFPLLAFAAVSARRGMLAALKRNAGALAASALVIAAYLVFIAQIKGGSLFPSDPSDPYHASFTLSTVAGKSTFGWWALGLPSGTGELKGHPRVMQLLGTVLPEGMLRAAGEISNLFVRPDRLLRLILMTPLVLAFLYALVFLWRRERAVPAGLLWFAASILPVLFLSTRLMRHNLYIPIVGIALILGPAVAAVRRRAGRYRPAAGAAVPVLFLALFVAGSALAVAGHLKYAWPVRSSRIAENALDAVRRLQPPLADGATLYVMKDDGGEDLYFQFEGGNLFRVFAGAGHLNVLFEEKGDQLPPYFLSDRTFHVLAYFDTEVYDLTPRLRQEAADKSSLRLIERLDPASVTVDESEPYALAGHYGTPGNRPVFPYRFARNGELRQALVTVAGARVPFPIPSIGPASRLSIGVAMVHNLGDGAMGKIWLEQDGVRHLMFSRALNPAQVPSDRRWFDAEIDLGRFAGKPAVLTLECGSGVAKDTGADWFGWSPLALRNH